MPARLRPKVAPGYRPHLPQWGARSGAFVASGQPCREHLLAILTDEPLGWDGMPADLEIPARVLSPADLNALLARLRGLEADRWTAPAPHFDVAAGSIERGAEDGRMKVREIIKLIAAEGWYRIKARGGHRQYKHLVKRGRVTVPGRLNADLDPKTEKSILKQAGLGP